MAAVMGLRQQHLNAAVANQHHSETDLSNFNLRSGTNDQTFVNLRFFLLFHNDFKNRAKIIS